VQKKRDREGRRLRPVEYKYDVADHSGKTSSQFAQSISSALQSFAPLNLSLVQSNSGHAVQHPPYHDACQHGERTLPVTSYPSHPRYILPALPFSPHLTTIHRCHRAPLRQCTTPAHSAGSHPTSAQPSSRGELAAPPQENRLLLDCGRR
jgi:hypothetical protein